MSESRELRYYDVKAFIGGLCRDESLTFVSRGKTVENSVSRCSKSDFLDHLDHAGIIPEFFGHDSTEEKTFAKHCDALLARAFCELGLTASTILERSDAADVEGACDDYTIVGDAKAFRLSRTAKNQKDFKIESLDKWRRGADFACLVGPIYQFPRKSSQIYQQAIRYNVTLLSYTHLAYMVRNAENIKQDRRLREIWEIPGSLQITKEARVYWSAVDRKMIDLSGQTPSNWEKAVATRYKALPEEARAEVRFWEDRKQQITELSHDNAVNELIKALKIDAKIAMIKRTAGL